MILSQYNVLCHPLDLPKLQDSAWPLNLDVHTHVYDIQEIFLDNGVIQ